MRTLTVALFLTLLTAAPSEGFSTYRCGNHIVQVGDHGFEVEAKCGEPKSRDLISEVKVRTRYMNKTQWVEEWLYDIRYGWWDVLTFRGGRLVKIQAVRK